MLIIVLLSLWRGVILRVSHALRATGLKVLNQVCQTSRQRHSRLIIFSSHNRNIYILISLYRYIYTYMFICNLFSHSPYHEVESELDRVAL